MLMSDAVEVTVVHEGLLARVRVAGVVDLHTAPVLVADVRDRVRAGEGDLVLDLAEVSFMDSSGLVALLELYEHYGERLRIVPGDTIEPLFRHARARSFLP